MFYEPFAVEQCAQWALLPPLELLLIAGDSTEPICANTLDWRAGAGNPNEYS